VKALLGDLAVKGPVSVATKKHALSALVFLFREALGRGTVKVRRGRPEGQRAPTTIAPKRATATLKPP
jgi:hypothetical protein